MDTKELRTLKLLEELEGEQLHSQRDLAASLNISLGLVNSFMKRLAKKGYFKISNIPSNRVRYILTPKGAAEKTRLTYQYIQYSFQFYKETRNKWQLVFSQLEKQQIRQVAFWGIGELAEISYISLQETQLELIAIFDATPSFGTFMGMRVRQPEELSSVAFERIIITSMGSPESSLDHLLRARVEREKIVLI